MTFSPLALKNDLTAVAQSAVCNHRKVWLSKVVENVVTAADNAVDLVKDEDLTDAEKVERVRLSLGLHLDWAYNMENVTADELAKFRAVVAAL